MKKQMVSITERQDKYLKQSSDELGISMAELIRRTVDWYMATYPPKVMVGVKKEADNDGRD